MSHRPISQKEKAERWDRLIGLLQNPDIRSTYIWHLSSMSRAVNMLLARREELPSSLVSELKSYQEKLEALRLEAIDGFDGSGEVMNFLPTYITESLVGGLCWRDNTGDLSQSFVIRPHGREAGQVMEFSLLRVERTDTLGEMSECIDVLLQHQNLLTPELRIKLESLRADISAELEDREDSGGGAS